MAKTKAVVRLSTSHQRRAREYEMIYILRASVHPDEADRIVSRFTETVGNLEGKLLKLNNWGRRRLAYPIKKETRGVFVYARFVGYDDLIAELERNLRLIDSVIRYQTILLNPHVDVDAIQIDPSEVEFQRLEIEEQDDEPQLAQRLGLVERSKRIISEPRPSLEDAEEGEAGDAEIDRSEEDDASEQEPETPAEQPSEIDNTEPMGDADSQSSESEDKDKTNEEPEA